MSLAPPGTICHIGKSKKEVTIKHAPEMLLNRLLYCANLDEAIAREYKITKAMRLTRDNISDTAKSLGTKVEIAKMMGAEVEALSLQELDRSNVSLIISEDVDREAFNIREVYHEQYTHITGSGVFIGSSKKPDGSLMAEECFLLLE